MPGSSLFAKTPKGTIRFAIRLTPKGASNKIGETVADAEGNLGLKASVTAVPENGKANSALIKMLAKAWKLPKRSLSIVSGATDRRKIIEIETDHIDDLIRHLESLISH